MISFYIIIEGRTIVNQIIFFFSLYYIYIYELTCLNIPFSLLIF